MELKFRAWDKKEKKMRNVDTLMWDEGELKLAELDCRFFAQNGGNQEYELDNIVLMQWTGLHDKMGVDIYEGDLLRIPYTYYDRIDCAIKVPYDEYIIGVVVFNQKSGVFGVILPEDEDELSKGFNSFDFVFENIGYECEVIGTRFKDKEMLLDIFEDLELLKGD